VTAPRRDNGRAHPALREARDESQFAPASSPGALAGAVDLRKLLAPVLRHRWLLLGGTIACSIAAAAFVRWELPQYRATATIRLDDLRRDVTVGIEAPEKASGPMTNPVVSEIQLLRSRELIGTVVDSLGLRLRPDFRHMSVPTLKNTHVADAAAPDTLELRFDRDTVRVTGRHINGKAPYGQPIRSGGLEFTVSERPPVETSKWFVVSREAAIDAVLDKIVVYPRVFSDVVDISYTGHRPTIVRRVVNNVVNGFVSAGVESATAAARKRREFLETQMRQNDSLLSDADEQLIAFRRHAQVFSTPARIDQQQRAVLDLDQRSAELKATRQTYQSLLTDVEAIRNGKARADALRSIASYPDLASNPAIATLVQQLLTQERVLDSLRTGPWRSAATDPDVQRTQALITDAQNNLLALVNGYVRSTDARAGALDQVRNRATSSLIALPAIDAEDARLARRVSTLANLNEYLRGEYQKARIAEGAAIGRAVVLDTAYTPYQPVAQFRSVKLIAGAMVGFLLSMLAAAVLEQRDTSIRRREDLESSTDMRVLGVVPRLDTPTARISNAAGRSPGFRGFARLNGAPAPEPATVRQHPANVLDAYRMLRVNVNRQGLHGSPASIVVTSAAPGDGKTTIAANLALAYAREGRRVLLVDCDLRRAAVHRMFRVPRGPGLAEALGGTASLQTCIQASGLSNFFVLTAGEAQSDSGQLLEGAAFRDAIAQLRGAFDVLVIDSAPVLAVADAAVLSSMVDGVIVVVRAGVTNRFDVVEVLRQLDTAGAVVLGTVINDPAGHLVEQPYSYYREYAAT
jgi:succinoglycan biosynthesis transport protein ExoP